MTGQLQPWVRSATLESTVSTKPSDIDPAEGTADPTVDSLVAAVRAKPVTGIADLDRYAAEIWDSDEELEAFLADVRASRSADLA